MGVNEITLKVTLEDNGDPQPVVTQSLRLESYGNGVELFIGDGAMCPEFLRNLANRIEEESIKFMKRTNT